MNKVHFKMFKAGKKWMVAGIATVAMSTGAFFVTSINANADVVSNASGYVGTPYAYGGTDASGIDCSGLVQAAYAQDGITLPRTSGAQYGVTTQESAADALPGDLVFFGNYGSDHVGIYSGNGNMVDAETDGVKNQSVALMETVLGQAAYGRVNGATRNAYVSSPVDTTLSQQAPATDNSQPSADNGNAQGDNTGATTPASDNSQANNNGSQAPVAQNNNNASASNTDASAQNNNNAPVAQANTDAAAPATDNAFASTDANNTNTVQNDNVVSVDKTADTSAQNTTDATPAATTTPAVSASNDKNTLPATGEANNSLLSVIGLALVSLAAMFGIKLRKNN